MVRKWLTETTKNVLIDLWSKLHSITAVAKRLHMSKSVVSRWVERFRTEKTVQAMKPTGRPRALTPEAAARAMQLLIEHHCTLQQAAQQLCEEGYTTTTVAPSTISKAAKEHAESAGQPIYAARGKPRQSLREANKATRVAFAKKHLKTDFRCFMFTDRKKFLLRHPGWSLSPVEWRKKGEKRSAPTVTNPVAVNLYLGITYWGMTKPILVAGTKNKKRTHYNLKGELGRNITGSEYNRDVLPWLLREGVRLFQKGNITFWVFQQDNDPSHSKAKLIIKEFSKQFGGVVRLMSAWPSNSPDLNPIENLWAIVDRAVKRHKVFTVEEFKAAVQEELTKVPLHQLRALIDSMHERLQKVIAAGGERISY